MTLRSLTTTKLPKLRFATATVALTLLASLAFPAATVLADTSSTPVADDHSQTVTSSEVASTLVHDGDILASSDQTKTSSDSDSAIKAVTAGASVDVPKDPSDGITLDPAGSTPAIDIQLPNADQAKNAQKVANGTVAYASNNGSANAVQATEDGGVRMLTIIDNPNAPTAYDYKVTVPDGGRVAPAKTGGAMILDGSGQPIATMATPWAKDANGTPVKTYFTTDGTNLVQHIEHNMPGVVYPVSADPQISFGWLIYLRLSPNDQRFMLNNGPTVFSGLVCAIITKSPKIAALCATAGGIVGNWLSIYFNPKHWIEVKFAYNGQLAGIKRL